MDEAEDDRVVHLRTTGWQDQCLKNDKKKIIAKKLPVKQLDDFLTKHEKFLQTKKPGDASSGSKGTTGQ